MEMTLLTKILWFFWIFMVFDILTDWIGKIPNERVRLYINGVLGIVTVVTFLAIALLPFINLLWK
jgi:hypothetical protein